MIRIALIAPTLALRLGLRSLLAPAAPESLRLTVIGEAASPAEFASTGLDTDVLVLAEGGSTIAAMRVCLPEDGGRSAVVFSDDPADAAALAALPLHGWALLPTDVSADELQAGVYAAAEGLIAVIPALFVPIFQQRKAALPASYDVSAGAEKLAPLENLTEREAQVLQLLAHGLANKQIALALSISEHTVKFHISSIYGKLGVTNRTEAVRAGLQLGLVTL